MSSSEQVYSRTSYSSGRAKELSVHYRYECKWLTAILPTVTLEEPAMIVAVLTVIFARCFQDTRFINELQLSKRSGTRRRIVVFNTTREDRHPFGVRIYGVHHSQSVTQIGSTYSRQLYVDIRPQILPRIRTSDVREMPVS